MTTLSGFRIMWMLVMFDLPVLTKAERKAANDFRNYLLGQGFERAQLSVYMRFCSGKEQTKSYVRKIKAHIPKGGLVDILMFTDKQYENIITFHAAEIQPRKMDDQLALF